MSPQRFHLLLCKFVQTDEDMLLEYAAHQLQKVLAAEPRDKKERQYQVSMECSGRTIRSSLVPAIFFSITLWCDGILLDYHLHFSQKPSEFRRLMNFSLTVGVFMPNKHGEITKSGNNDKIVRKRVKTYIKRSVMAAYIRMADSLDLKSKVENMHPLVLLADNLKLIIRKEVAVFCPVMHQWYPETGKISSTLLHQLFGERLKPFLQDCSSLSQDAKSVLSAAYMLDQELSELHMLESEGNDTTHPLNYVLDHYNIGEVSVPLVLDWVISQHTHILDSIGRAFNLEEERVVMPPNADASDADNVAASVTSHGIQMALEFKPVEHPIEPLDSDQPVNCPQPEPSILNDGRVWKERVSAASIRRRTDSSLTSEGAADSDGIVRTFHPIT